MHHFRKFIAVAVLLLLAACTAEREGADVRAAIDSVSIRDVQIEIDPQVYTGLPAMDGKSPQDQLREFTAALTYALKNQVIGKPGGAIPARLVVRLHQVDLASGLGRAVIGRGSSVVGRATIVDLKKSNRLIAQSPDLIANEGSISGSGNIGVLVALAVKVADAASEARAERMARYFAASVDRWLVRR